jgi:hypothetical protein
MNGMIGSLGTASVPVGEMEMLEAQRACRRPAAPARAPSARLDVSMLGSQAHY